MANYDYTNQAVQATCLIENKDIDSFYNPTSMNHTGYAWDGTLYSSGVQQTGPVYASWYTEGESLYRGTLQAFPQEGLIILSKVSLTILDGSSSALNFWMQFLNQDQYALANNWNSGENGWLPFNVVYADGIISVIYTPDSGNQTGVDGNTYDISSNMVVHLDFSTDSTYLDVAI